MTEPNGSPLAPTRHDALALLVLLAAVLWPFRDALVGDGCMLSFDTRRTGFAPFQLEKPPDVDARPANLVTSDINGWIVPEVELMVREMRAGRVPLWNPYVLCGQPLLANLAFSPFYPPNWLALVVDPVRALAWIVVLHFWLAGAFAYLWLRMHGNARGASLVGALAVALTSWLTTRFHLPSIAMTAAWFFGLLWAFDRIVRRPTLGRQLVLAVLVGGACLAGFPQIALLELTGLFVYACVRWVQQRPPFAPIARCVVGGVVLGVALASIQLLPTVALFQESLRSVYAPKVGAHALNVAALCGLFHPYAFGDPVRLLGQVASLSDYLPHRLALGSDIQENAVENALWLGVLPLALAAAAFTCLRRERALAALAVVAIVGIGLAFGLPLPFLDAGSPKRALVLMVLPFAAAAGFGWSALARRQRGATVAAFAVLGLLTAAYAMFVGTRAAGSLFEPSAERGIRANDITLFVDHLRETSKLPLAVTLGAIIAVLLVRKWPRAALAVGLAVIAVDLGSFARGFNPAQERKGQYPQTPAVAFVRDSGERTIRAYDITPLPALIGPMLGYRSADGGEPMVTRRIAELYEALEPGRFDPRDPRLMKPFTDMSVFADPLFLRTATSLIVANRMLQLADAEVVYANETEGLGVYRLKNALPRVRLVAGWNEIGSYELQFAALCDRATDPRRVVMLEDTFAEFQSNVPGPGDPPAGTARIVREGPTELTVEVAGLDRDAWLVLADTYDEGWNATCVEDGAKPNRVGVYRADHAFRAVRVGPKTKEVTFRYEPRAFTVGAYITGFIAIMMMIGAIVVRRRSKAGNPAASVSG